MSGNILSVIPARKGSKGIPRKNVRELAGKPLVAHAIETSMKSSMVDHVALTTDSQEIAQIGRRYEVDTVIDRPLRLAKDDVPLAPVIQHAYEETNKEYSYVLCFQPTVPLISTTSIDEGILHSLEKGSDSVIYVRDSTHHYWKEIKSGFEPVSMERENRQQMDPVLEEVGLFFTHADLVLEGRRISSSPELYEVDIWEGTDIDTHADWLVAESRLQRNQLIYRLIGDQSTGTGHVFRGITIADHLFKHDVLFAVTEADELAIDKLEESNYNFKVFENEADFLQFLRSSNPDVVVNDILDTSAGYMKQLKQMIPRVVNFEDLGDGTEHADAVINALYEHSDPLPNHFFGFKYFCLRGEFRYVNPRAEIPSVDRIMISFGGTDENNLTAKTLSALAELDEDLHLDIVLGLGYTNRSTLDSILGSYPSHISVEINQDIDSMAEHMNKADLLITSNGRTLYEAGSLNLPVISIAQNDREQKHPYAHISRGILSLGQADYVSEQNILMAVQDYIDDAEKRETMQQALSKHDITNGVDRIKRIIFEEPYEDW